MQNTKKSITHIIAKFHKTTYRKLPEKERYNCQMSNHQKKIQWYLQWSERKELISMLVKYYSELS